MENLFLARILDFGVFLFPLGGPWAHPRGLPGKAMGPQGPMGPMGPPWDPREHPLGSQGIPLGPQGAQGGQAPLGPFPNPPAWEPWKIQLAKGVKAACPRADTVAIQYIANPFDITDNANAGLLRYASDQFFGFTDPEL